MLYRDVWYGYTPLAPYGTRCLFRTFGANLNVLYWAGSLAALGCAVLLFLSGRRLGSPLAGWTAGADPADGSVSRLALFLSAGVQLLGRVRLPERVPVPVVALHAAGSADWGWMFAAASVAAMALLLKAGIRSGLLLSPVRC